MPRVVTGTVTGGASMSTPAQITIRGTLEKEAIAALVEIALSAGAALVVEPRVVTTVIEAVPPRRALPPARAVVRRRGAPGMRTGGDRRDGAMPDAARAQQALREGPLRLKELLRATKLSLYQVRQLVDAGVVVATGATAARRYALPGQRAKEAP